MSSSAGKPRLRKLATVLPLSATLLSLGAFAVVALVVYVGANRAGLQQADAAARQVATTTRRCLEQVMEGGASREVIEQAARAALGVRGAAPDFAVTLHSRARLAEAGGARMDARLAAAFATGREASSRQDDVARFYFPVIVKKSCTACHVGTGEGHVLGVLEVGHDLGPELRVQRQGVVWLLLAVFPVPILLALVAARRFTRRLARSVEVVHEGTRKVGRGEELAAVDLAAVEPGYVELDELFAEVRGLAEALMETRDLRLQLGALDAMALTAEAVRDWRNEMSRVVAALRRSIPLRALVTAFARPEGAVDVVVFWNGESSGAERRALVDLTRARWEGTGAAPDQAAFAHADLPGPRGDSPPPPPLDACRTSFFGVRVPQVGGVTQVGLAIAGDFAVRPLALRGVLATLANAAGALRAIDGYVRQIEFHATRDALTELPNRRMFFELLHYEVERARRHGYLFAVLVLDLDGFKQVNDTYGHAYGDVFLAALAANLREIARTEDVLARYGGDEFVMLLSGANAEHARAVGERLIERVAAFTLTAPDGAVLHAGVSVGVAVHPRDAASADELFRRADTEMYRAKAAGKGCLRMAGEG